MAKFRYERKFLIGEKNIFFIENMLRFSKFRFKKKYFSRQVNSIYFDTLNLKIANANLDGDSFKTKVRLRWYGLEKVIANPVLELKKKIGYLNYKKIYKINNSISLKFNFENLQKIFNLITFENKIILNLKPISSTHYKRIYFESSLNNKIRATIDYDFFSYFFKNTNNVKFKKSFFNPILEIKYPSNYDEYVRNAIDISGFRLSKNSKYVNSIFKSCNRVE